MQHNRRHGATEEQTILSDIKITSVLARTAVVSSAEGGICEAMEDN